MQTFVIQWNLTALQQMQPMYLFNKIANEDNNYPGSYDALVAIIEGKCDSMLDGTDVKRTIYIEAKNFEDIAYIINTVTFKFPVLERDDGVTSLAKLMYGIVLQQPLTSPLHLITNTGIWLD